MNDQFLVDEIESELSVEDFGQLQDLKKKNVRFQESAEDIIKAKDVIKQDSSGELPNLDSDYFNKLHSKIMAKVDQSPGAVLPKRRFFKILGSGVSLALGIVLTVWVGVPMLSSYIRNQTLYSASDIESVRTINRSESDFFVDVASENFQNLSQAELNKIFKRR